MARQTIGADDSIPGIAKAAGFFWRTIWEHPENAELKARRKDPNLLCAGDEVFVPDRQQKWVERATGATHEFQRLGDPVEFKLVLRKMGKPRKDEPYVLRVGGAIIEGKTDGDGKLSTFIPGDARTATLILNQGREEYPLRISRLDPIDELSGVQQRLNNLGFACGAADGELTPRTGQALRRFQAARGLDPTGDVDAPTRDALAALHP